MRPKWLASSLFLELPKTSRSVHKLKVKSTSLPGSVFRYGTVSARNAGSPPMQCSYAR